MRTLRLTMVAVCSLAVGACGDGDEMTTFTETDSGSEIEIEQGESFELRLESNASTGYAWEVDAMSTEGLVELRSSTYVDDSDDDVEGAPGIEVFEFEANGDGAGVLRLVYIRSWEDPPVPDRVAEYIIRIDGAPWPPADLPDPPGTSGATAPIEIGALLEGGAADDVLVAGFVVLTPGQDRFCEVLAESYPPQCGGAKVTIANPDDLDKPLEEAQGVRWTQARVELRGDFDGNELTVAG